MWISKQEYKSLTEEVERLSQDSRNWHVLLDSLRSAPERTIHWPGVSLVQDEWFHEITQKLDAQKKSIMSLTAARDWYKQKYAELLAASEVKG